MRKGVTVLLVEQYRNSSLVIHHRPSVLENGRIVMGGTGAELAANEQVKEACLVLDSSPSLRIFFVGVQGAEFFDQDLAVREGQLEIKGAHHQDPDCFP
jgi:hypothetical protein